MASSWKKRLRRGRVGWLGRIDGVEKPALLVGLGLVLYRVWKAGEPGVTTSGRWRQTLRRWRHQIEHTLARVARGDDHPRESDEAADEASDEASDQASAKQEVPDGPAGAAQRDQRQEQAGLGHPLP